MVTLQPEFAGFWDLVTVGATLAVRRSCRLVVRRCSSGPPMMEHGVVIEKMVTKMRQQRDQTPWFHATKTTNNSACYRLLRHDWQMPTGTSELSQQCSCTSCTLQLRCSIITVCICFPWHQPQGLPCQTKLSIHSELQYKCTRRECNGIPTTAAILGRSGSAEAVATPLSLRLWNQ